MTEPTDAELEALLVDKAPILALVGANVRTAVVKAMREAFAKFGTPPAVAGEPDYATFALWYADHIGDENKPVRDAALATYEAFAPTQPTQAQAGAVPLTRERLQEISLDYSDSEDECIGFRDGWRAAEKHHGIKGGQHGPT